ncbi:MAG: NCS2 family permease [Candidatus Hydrogenedentes bacterium]|nr:NCS2 family permease [Candidatus Hydrogenedentota bacterium]
MTNALERYFGVQEAGSTLRREVVGGLTTFATMSYIVFVQPTVLSAAGMPFGSVLLATCLSSALACFLMGLLARYPFALAPGMGENFFFAFTVCSTFPGAMGFSWQAGLAIVLISGLLFVALSLFGVREQVLRILPDCLKNTIGPAIGFFISFVGLQWGGIIKLSPTTMVTLGDLHTGAPVITLIGVFLIATMMALRIQGGILIGIVVTCILGLASGVMKYPQDTVHLSTETFFNLNFAELASKWDAALIAILLFFFMVLFDTVGTLVGVGRQAGFVDEAGTLPRARQAFFADAMATCIGALFGTSTVTSYIESATGVAAGARTGLAAVVTGMCFLLAIVAAPLVHIVGYDVGPAFYGVGPTDLHVAMYPGVAPALIVVGLLMMAPLRLVQWDDVTESLPSFFTVAMMVFGYAIHEGISAGCISYAAIKLLSGRGKEVHPIMYGIAIALAARYVFLR